MNNELTREQEDAIISHAARIRANRRWARGMSDSDKAAHAAGRAKIKAYTLLKPYSCGHARTAENSHYFGKPHARCRLCHNAKTAATARVRREKEPPSERG